MTQEAITKHLRVLLGIALLGSPMSCCFVCLFHFFSLCLPCFHRNYHLIAHSDLLESIYFLDIIAFAYWLILVLRVYRQTENSQVLVKEKII